MENKMGKVIFISGASKGIGAQIAATLRSVGHTVYGTSRDPDQSASNGHNLIALDVREEGSVRSVVAEVLDKEGRIDVLVNNAGYDLYGAVEETSVAENISQMDTNYFGVVRLTQEVLPHMRERRSGKIIMMGSIGGSIGLPYNAAYAASKFALEGYSESLRLEMRPFQVYVSVVQPGPVATETLDTSIVGVGRAHPAYQRQRELMIEKMRTMGRQSPVTPLMVAQKVAEIIDSEQPKFRYPVGRQAGTLPWVKQLLPQDWFERFMLQQFWVV
jgi:short-subunit dehydrogenase